MGRCMRANGIDTRRRPPQVGACGPTLARARLAYALLAPADEERLPMGLRDWYMRRSVTKARSNLRSTLKKLAPAADASWANTERCILAEFWPLPETDPNVVAYQTELLKQLMVWKGSLSDREAVEFIGAEMQGAGVGAKMAVRHVVITEWPKHGKPAITQAEIEEILGSRDEDAKRTERVRAYALHHLALEQAVSDVTGKRPERPT